jgi:hypothetical protein
MSDKPSYLGLLNAIAVNEARGHALYDAWAATTQDPELARTLKTVAIRECEHAAVFTKRLCELGYEVRDEPAADFDARLATLKSDSSDTQKFENVFGFGRESPKAVERGLAEIFDDKTIDPVTGKLLGRFIAEEHDSRRRLQARSTPPPSMNFRNASSGSRGRFVSSRRRAKPGIDAAVKQ